ncbi:hypothetical protein [Blastopirellula marina]|uniref:Leucine Rich repeats (2 copies) n=1 Tax=Blastopirellula marina TaxID=124 RepID=A0A2S8F989_9BACT|nr:hypothetical protein [Blastopirellula marina]PQO28705.1 hypothetical protein C5Y98_23260 [Blastopirellula marina]PTL41978.1 hypothetical protein C5Y97_23270 [Blastopirellula marina]
MNQSSNSWLFGRQLRFRFSLRGLFIFLLILSLPLGWLGRHIIRSRQETAFAASVSQAGGEVRFDYNAAGPAFPADQPKGPWLLRQAFGQNLFSYVCSADLSRVKNPNAFETSLGQMATMDTLSLPAGPLSDELIESIARLPNLSELTLNGSSITPTQMRRLATDNSILALNLSGAAAADGVLKQLHHFRHLPNVTITAGATTDQGLKALSQVDSIFTLEIRGMPAVTNSGFRYLTRLPNLRALQISGTQITEDCVSDLAQMTQLQLAEISPGNLKHQYRNLQMFRLDTLEPIDDPYPQLSRWDCGVPENIQCIRCVRVEKNLIRLDFWDQPYETK